jgi:predicted membrane chloride channel (bestrophin family)
VFPHALKLAIPGALIAAAIRLGIDYEYLHVLQWTDQFSILKDAQAWGGISFLVGFLVVFRTSQAYSRFWEGCTATHQMRAEWFDACCALISYTKYSKAGEDKINEFKHSLVRLFSMLHAAALAELEEINADIQRIEDINAFQFNLIDPMAIDTESLRAVKFSTSKVELIFTWIQNLIVENIDSGVMSIPAPILSLALGEVASGMVAFHNAIKITYIPFPFPYSQTCDCLLMIHWILCPIVTALWCSTAYWAFVFVLMQVVILWSLDFIAVEIENPFGTDANDIDGSHMQAEMNRHLLLLLEPESSVTPKLQATDLTCSAGDIALASFVDIWSALDADAEGCVVTARKGANFIRALIPTPPPTTPPDEDRWRGPARTSWMSTRSSTKSRSPSVGSAQKAAAGGPRTSRTCAETNLLSFDRTSMGESKRIWSSHHSDDIDLRGSWEAVPVEDLQQRHSGTYSDAEDARAPEWHAARSSQSDYSHSSDISSAMGRQEVESEVPGSRRSSVTRLETKLSGSLARAREAKQRAAASSMPPGDRGPGPAVYGAGIRATHSITSI